MPITINDEITRHKVYRINDDLIMKTEEFRDNDDLQHEYEIGRQINQWQLPNFVDTITLVQGCAPQGSKGDNDYVAACSLSHTDCDQPYLVTSLVKDAQPLCDIDDEDVVINVVTQVILLLHYLNQRYGFTHYDLHWRNILVVDLLNKHRLKYPDYEDTGCPHVTGYTVYSRYLPVIIDYGRAYTDEVGGVKDVITTASVITNSVDPTSSCLLHDIIYLLYSNEEACYLNPLRTLYDLPVTVDHSNDTEEERLKRLTDFIFTQVGSLRVDLLKPAKLQLLKSRANSLQLQQLLHMQLIYPDLFDATSVTETYVKHDLNLDECQEVISGISTTTTTTADANIDTSYLFEQRIRKYYKLCLKLAVNKYFGKLSEVELDCHSQQLTELGQRLQQQQLVIQQTENWSICHCLDCDLERDGGGGGGPNKVDTYLLDRVTYKEHLNLDWLVVNYGQQIRGLQQAADTKGLFKLFNDFGQDHWLSCEHKTVNRRHQLDISLFVDFFYIVCSREISQHTSHSVMCGNEQLISIMSYHYDLRCFHAEGCD